MEKRHVGANRVVALVLALALLFSFTACKESPKLQKINYVNGAEVDKENQQNDNDNNHQQEDDNLASNKLNEESKKQDYDNQKDKPMPAPENSQFRGETAGPAGSGASDNTGGSAENLDGDTAEESGSGETDVLTPSSAPALRQLVDANGRMVDVPKDVNSVVACGDVAPYVAMLGGASYISVTSDSFKYNDIANSTFDKRSMDKMLSLWEGDGGSKISSDNFGKLLSAKPEVCFIISGQSLFTDEQYAQLNANYIYPVTLPKLNTVDNIKVAVGLIADVLGSPNGDSSKKDAAQIGGRYIAWLDEIIAELKSKNRSFSGPQFKDFNNDYMVSKVDIQNTNQNSTGPFTLLISSWDDSAAYALGSMRGTGMPVTYSGYSHSPTAYAMSLGGVANNAALSNSISYYCYVSPMGFDSTVRLSVSGGRYTWNRDISKNMVEISEGLNGVKSSIGTPQFRTIIAGTNAVRSNLLSSELWKQYPVVNSGTSTFNGTYINGNLVRSYIEGSYDIYVTPGGVGSWISGSPEAFLEGVFINSIFYGDYSETDLKTKVKSFYATFYNYTPSSDVLNKIISGYSS